MKYGYSCGLVRNGLKLYLHGSLKFFHAVSDSVRLVDHLKNGITYWRLVKKVVYRHDVKESWFGLIIWD